MDRRGLAARVLEDLVMAVPVGAWLTDMSYDGARVQAKGLAPSNSVVADYIAKLGGSTVLEDVNLQTSVERKIRNRNWREFSVQAAVKGTRGQEPSASGSERSSTSAAGADANDVAALTARLAELEKDLPARKDSAETLRQFELAASESGLKITKFAPGAEIPVEHYREWPVAIEVAGSRQGFGIFLEKVGRSPGPWLVKSFSFKAVSAQDVGPPIRASLAAETLFAK